MKNHIMLDLETISTRPGAAIMSIGAATFDPYEDYTDDFPEDMKLHYNNVDINSCIELGMHVDGNTILWWMEQGKDAIDALTNPKPIHIRNAFKQFKDFYWDCKNEVGKDNDVYIWAHGASFDPPHIHVAANLLGEREPWLYYNVRDTRTLFDLAFDGEKPSFEGFGTKHNALHDSLTQIIHVQEAYRKLGKTR